MPTPAELDLTAVLIRPNDMKKKIFQCLIFVRRPCEIVLIEFLTGSCAKVVIFQEYVSAAPFFVSLILIVNDDDV